MPYFILRIPGVSLEARRWKVIVGKVLIIYICCIEMVEGGMAASRDLEQLDGNTIRNNSPRQ